MSQLQMIFPAEKLADVQIPKAADGFILRTYQEGDGQAYIDLMCAAGFQNDWNEERLQTTLKGAFKDGIFFAVEVSTGRLAATAMANLPNAEGKCEFGWVGTDPAFRGKGLGNLVCAAVLNKFYREGQTKVTLLTDDFRVPAIKLYLKEGWKPLMADETHPRRWKALSELPELKGLL